MPSNHKKQPGQGPFDFDPGTKSVRDEPLDEFYLSMGFLNIAGVDEAGRGALAGPVSAAAVILGSAEIDGLNDSKKLTPGIRAELCDLIWRKAKCVGVAMVGSGRIDESNILQAAMEAMALAVRMLAETPGIVLVDGNQVPAGIENTVAIVKGDSKSRNIMAASIVAKVTRDRWMDRVASEYPEYGFEKHKGYAVPAHYKALEKCGVTPIHRMTFAPCRKVAGGLQGAGGTGKIDPREYEGPDRERSL